MVALIVVAVIVVVRAGRRRAHDPHHPAGPRRGARAPRPLQPHARAGPDDRHAVHRPRAAAGRPARAGRELLAAVGDHRGQRRRGIETVLYFTITDPRAATYEIANPLQAIEQLTVTTLRNVIGGLTLEETLTSREGVNAELRTVLDEATGKWGIRINRVEIKSVDPPAGHQDRDGEADARRARPPRRDPDRRGEKQAQILTAEGAKQAAVLTAEGAQQAAVLDAEGERQSRSCAPRARRRRSRRCSKRSTRATPTASCSATSTCRCCRSSPRATPTRCS